MVLTSRNGVKNSYQKRLINRWKQKGVDIRVVTSDVAKKDDAEQLLRDSAKRGPVGGIFHLAVVSKVCYFTDVALNAGHLDFYHPE